MHDGTTKNMKCELWHLIEKCALKNLSGDLSDVIIIKWFRL